MYMLQSCSRYTGVMSLPQPLEKQQHNIEDSKSGGGFKCPMTDISPSRYTDQ